MNSERSFGFVRESLDEAKFSSNPKKPKPIAGGHLGQRLLTGLEYIVYPFPIEA